MAMAHQLVIQFLNRTYYVVAQAEVTESDGLFRGTIDLALMPVRVRRVFEEYEEIVNNQSLGLLDEIEDKISDLALHVSFGESTAFTVEDLQIHPNSARVSFRLGQTDLDAAADYVLKKNLELCERLT